MPVNFNDDTWKFVEALCKEGIEKAQSLCVQPATTWEEVLQARGTVLALKTILNKPQTAMSVAANTRK